MLAAILGDYPLASYIYSRYIYVNLIIAAIFPQAISRFNPFHFPRKVIIMKKTAIVLVSLLFAACASTKTDAPQAAQPAAKNTAVETPVTAPVSAAEVAANQLAAELQALQKESVYFDFDKSAVKSEFQDALRKQADFLKSHKNDVVTLEGNCDERGSSKYNLALGERRAQAVKKSLRLLGVSPTQIKTVSYGKERPRLQCHEEKCWKENRRADFVHSLK